METTFPKVLSLAKFTFRLLLLLFSLCVLSFSTSFWFPALLRFSRRFPINFLLIARRITKHGSLKLVDAVTCKGKRKLTGFDSPAKCCSFFFRFFLLLWGKKKSHKYCRVCVFCVVLSALCGFMAVGEKMLSRLGIFVSSRRCLGENRRARIVQQYWFRLFFSGFFCPFLLRVKVSKGLKWRGGDVSQDRWKKLRHSTQQIEVKSSTKLLGLLSQYITGFRFFRQSFSLCF